MKNGSKIILMCLCLCLSATTIVNAQKTAQPQQKEQIKKNQKNNSIEYSTEVYYFSKNKLTEDALRKKILKLSGVKDVQINMGSSSITVRFDSKKNTKDKLKKSFNKWGTPGDFGDKQSANKGSKNTHNEKDKPAASQKSQGERH